MEIYETKPREGIQIQIKPLKNQKGSRSFTVKDINPDEAYARIFFLFEQLSQADNNITIIHYKTKGEHKNEEKSN